MSRRRALSAMRWSTCVLLASACGQTAPAPQHQEAQLQALTTSGEPLAGVRFWADGRDLGATNARGSLHAQLAGREGASVELTAACPPAFRTVTPRRRVVLRRVLSSGATQPRGVELSIRCEPLERLAALVVLTSGVDAHGLPVEVEGEVVGQIDADGCAHLLVSAPPRSVLRVVLDSSRYPQLRPQRPVHSFRLQDDHSILLVEQRFTREPPTPRRRAPPAPRGFRRPQRIE